MLAELRALVSSSKQPVLLTIILHAGCSSGLLKLYSALSAPNYAASINLVEFLCLNMQSGAFFPNDIRFV
jgi:hypothetical protein